MEPFLGMVATFAFNFAPQGWAECNGQILAINQNTALFSLIGTYYGGDGVNTFALPNLQSRVAIHQGEGLGLSPYVIGQAEGVEAVTLTAQEMPQHTHTPQASTLGASNPSPTNNVWATEPTGSSAFYRSSGNTTMSTTALSSSGGSQPHTNIQPYLVINFCIALAGIYPSHN